MTFACCSIGLILCMNELFYSNYIFQSSTLVCTIKKWYCLHFNCWHAGMYVVRIYQNCLGAVTLLSSLFWGVLHPLLCKCTQPRQCFRGCCTPVRMMACKANLYLIKHLYTCKYIAIDCTIVTLVEDRGWTPPPCTSYFKIMARTLVERAWLSWWLHMAMGHVICIHVRVRVCTYTLIRPICMYVCIYSTLHYCLVQ